MSSVSLPTPLSRPANTSWLQPSVITWVCSAVMILLQAYIVFIAYEFDGPKWLAHFADDLLYYVVPAQHFVETGRSSSTASPHQRLPSALVRRERRAQRGVRSGGRHLFRRRAGDLVRSLPRRHGRRPAASPPDGPRVALRETICFLYFAAAFLISRDGMETALVVGLAPWWLLMAGRLWRLPADNVALLGFGFLGSLVLLSRLDTLTLVVPVALALVLNWWRNSDGVEAMRRALVAASGAFWCRSIS